VSGFKRRPFNVFLAGADELNDETGRYEETESTTQVIKATMQPASGHDLQVFPEGRRTREAYKFYTSSFLEEYERGEDQNPPVIEDPATGKKYEVQLIAPWRNGVICHTKIMAVYCRNDAN